MPMSSSLPSIDWRGFRDRPINNVVDLDIRAIQRRLDARRDDPRRWLKGTFRAPKEARPNQYLALRNEAVKRFVRAMEAQGWRLRPEGRITVAKSGFAVTEPGDNKVQEDQTEYVITALFEKERPKLVRVELPDSMLKPTEMW